MNVQYQLATMADLEELVILVGHYHEFDSIESSPQERRVAITPLIDSNQNLGFILVAKIDGNIIGYIAVCYGYSIEFGGRDAFIDEFYIQQNMREQGIGLALLNKAKAEAKHHSVKAMHLEVTNTNSQAKLLYQQNGFSFRDAFHLMSCYL